MGVGGGFLPPTGHVAMSGDVFGCHGWGVGGCAIGIWWVEARGATKHPTGHGTVP